MKKQLNVLITSLLGLSLVIFSGCSSDSNDEGITYAASGVIVDPYIVGAVMCEDKNKDGVCGSDEQVSTASDANGVYKFTKALTVGSNIIIKTQGKHEGVTYDLQISSAVTQALSAGVTSPLTTFNTKGLTTIQIANFLNEAAINETLKLSDGTTDWRITANDIALNPLANDIVNTKIGNLNESDLIKIQASLATYGILKIMKGSTTLNDLNASQLYDSAMNENGHSEVHNITKGILKALTATLNKTMLDNIKTSIDSGRIALATGLTAHPSYDAAAATALANSSMPEPTIGLLIKVAVSIIDKLAQTGFDICNSTSGDDATKVTAALAAVANESTNLSTKAIELGSTFYGLVYEKELGGLNVLGYDARQNLPSEIQTGIAAAQAGGISFRFDTSTTFTSR